MRKLFFIVLLVLLCNINSPPEAQAAQTNLDFRRAPGVTQKEIDAIEAIKASKRAFIYGSMLSSESFLDENGQIQGYAVNMCALLTELFGIPFTPALFDWEDLVDGLASKYIDFSGEFTATPERRETYLMSGDIAVRPVTLFYPANGKSIEEIARTRLPIIGFLRGSVPLSQLGEMYGGRIEPCYFNRLASVSTALATGRVDAFIGDSSVEPFLQLGNDQEIVTQINSPPIYNSVSLATGNPELWAFISVFDKVINSGGQERLSALYSQGMSNYTLAAMRKKFNAEEKTYIDKHLEPGTEIPIILESDNYPMSFYNKQTKEYQGIVPDQIAKISALTGLQFTTINAPDETWSTVLQRLESGQAALISELLHTDAREGCFLWPKEATSVTRLALLSKSDYPNLESYEILGKRIGVEANTVYQIVAKQWFPNAELLIYDSIDEAFEALEKDETDLIMASEFLLLSQTNYSEKPGYKVNLALDYTIESKIGFRIDQEVLVSIFDKAFPHIQNDTIVRRWLSRVFDYSSQLTQARVYLLLTSTVLLSAFMALLVAFLLKNTRHRRDLSFLVKARTAQLEEKTATLSTVYSAIPDLLFCKDTLGRYTSCNPSFEAFAGMPESELLGKDIAEVFPDMEPKARDQGVDQDLDVLHSNRTFATEQLVTYPNGEQRLLETIKTPLVQNAAVVGMLGISRDITAHKAAQEAAHAASKAKSSFLARMSHEMRTPLNAIIGMAEIAKTSVGNVSKIIASVDQIIVSSHHLLRLINDVLDMSKIESGKLELAEEPFSLAGALSEALTIVTPHCKEKGLVFDHNVNELGDVVIVGDKLRVNQVLVNLLSNAAKFTDEGGHIGLLVSIVAETPKDVRIRFSVRDRGIGMTEELKSRLFKPFEQGDSSIASRFGGTGLGLSISNNLVQRMGGTIALESVEGQGSEFSFELAFKKGELAEAQEEPRELDLSGSRLLLVDDIEINRLIVEELLSSTRVSMDMAVNGREAVEMFEQSPPGHYSLIFMDIQMPEMDGYEATASIRALSHPDAETIPIIAMTANAYKEDVEQSFAAGMNGHIGKPIDTPKMMRVLETHLTSKG